MAKLLADIFIEGHVFSEARARAAQKGGRVWLYDPNKKTKQIIAGLVREVYKDEPTEAPVMINATFVANRVGEHGYWLGKPDVDNAIKILMDAFQGVFYYDDRQVAECHQKKLIFPLDGTHVQVYELEARDRPIKQS